LRGVLLVGSWYRDSPMHGPEDFVLIVSDPDS
jgi:hypothetical protein